ncbi:bacteriocin [Streptococcus sp. Marseille-Q5986]|uniref:bacteriocin n=1 Tax=Streptococcus sp. Marseille-Q5986 TaxID=2972782 RepID=UPI002263E08D|nr:bacteriocin [Streptococcus sp. Marseille-Q5986]
MRLERSHFLWKNAIQDEKLTVEEIDYKIDKKDVCCRCRLTKIYFKEVLAMTGTEQFAVLSTEELDQISGGKVIFLGDSDNCPYPGEFSPYLNSSSLNNYRNSWRYGLFAG